jgi:hypothetical protein
MPLNCPVCSAVLPEKAAFCPRCGRGTESKVAIKETTASLLRQAASMLQKHSKRKLGVQFAGRWGFDDASPRSKTARIRFHTGLGILDSSRAFEVVPSQGKALFLNGSWDDITIHVFQEAGFEDARAFAEAYREHTGHNIEIVKKYL